MSHKERMKVIEQEGSGGFALEEVEKLDSATVEKVQGTVDVSEIVAKYDKESAYRTFKGWLEVFIRVVCIAFSGFHLFTAATGAYPPQIQRAVHLGFVLVLIYLLYPARATGSKHKLAWYDVLLAAAGAAVCGYIVWNYDVIVLDAGPPTEMDFFFGCAAILLVLEATRRIVGLPITLVAICFLLYAKFGNLIPGMMGHPGFSLKRIVGHMYLTTEGLFGMPLGVSASFVFLFILFGAFLHSTGLGKFFIDLALAAAGRFVGGPAKVAVLASGFFGTISGSSVANTVSTGTFTIPLMKANGYDKNFAGAVEAVASNGGQILPPVMGSVAFLMAEMIGVSYFTVAKAAAVPALLYFFAVGIAVYFEAKRLNLRPDPNAQYERVGVVFKSGFYYLLPIALLIVFIICGYSVLRAGAYAAILTIALSYVKKDTAFHLKDFGAVVTDVAKQVRPIVAACACAGIIMGITSLTNLGIKLSGLIVTVSQGNLMIALVMTMLVSLVMGMGLPTTAAYLLLAVLGAPALIKLGADPLPAHLFILYFGCMSTITPPVALSTYAAAGISGGSPMKTGIYAMKLASVAFLIPYIFVYGQELLLYGSLGSILLAILSASLGCVALAGGMIGWLGAKMPIPLRFVLVGAAITLMIPGALTDVIGVVLMAACVITAVTLSKRQTPKIQ